MFKKTCWGVKNKESNVQEARAAHEGLGSTLSDPVHRYHHQRVSRKDEARCDVSAHCRGFKKRSKGEEQNRSPSDGGYSGQRRGNGNLVG